MKMFRILRNALRYNEKELEKIAMCALTVAGYYCGRVISTAPSCILLGPHAAFVLRGDSLRQTAVVEWYRAATGANEQKSGFRGVRDEWWFSPTKAGEKFRASYRHQMLIKFHSEAVETLRIRRKWVNFWKNAQEHT